jgi:signal transduction histidine kinase
MDAERNSKLIESGLTLSSELSFEVVLRRIVQIAMEITGARYGALGVLDDQGMIEEFITEGLTAEQRSAIGDLPTGHGVLGVLIDEGRGLRIRDISKHPRSSGFPPNHPPMRSFLGTPVVARGHMFGRLYLTEKQGAEEFDEEDEQAVIILAAQAGVAIENARLYEETQRQAGVIRQLTVLEDRERIAKELHDGVIQALFAVGMDLQATATLADDDGLERRLEGAIEEIDGAIRDLRNYIFGLRPRVLVDRELDQALRELAAEFEKKSGVVTVVQVDEEVMGKLSSSSSDVVQFVRESLSNVGKHASATTCRIVVRRWPAGGACIEVDDDGIGFDVEGTHSGMGLENLRDRIVSLEGAFSVESSPDSGTTVRATLPV